MVQGLDEIGYFGLAKRDLERGGEQVFIVTEQPVARSKLTELACRYDITEREADADSPYRWFVVALSEDEVARLA